MRQNNRANDQIRPLIFTAEYNKYAAGSVLLELGHTRVLATVTLLHSVPLFLRNKNQGWLTASYSLLPMSCRVRVERDSCGKRNDRAIEISRLIGRTLRAVVSLDKLPDKTIQIDCDVLQADGGTRAASITAACFALQLAEKQWLNEKIITQPILRESIAAISVGIINDTPLLDLDYEEDAKAEADFNFVMTQTGHIIEVQGTAEKDPIAWDQIMVMKDLAQQGVEQLSDKLYGKNSTAGCPLSSTKLILEKNNSI